MPARSARLVSIIVLPRCECSVQTTIAQKGRKYCRGRRSWQSISWQESGREQSQQPSPYSITSSPSATSRFPSSAPLFTGASFTGDAGRDGYCGVKCSHSSPLLDKELMTEEENEQKLP